MGIYLNPGNKKFENAVKSEIYVDKTMLLSITNSKINTLKQNICISRPRRFGKTMAANMLAAYYGRGCASKALFKGLKIAEADSFEALRAYIDMNFEGLKDDVLSMIAGERIPVRTGGFVNDMTSFEVEDDVLTLLIHLGYLAYDIDNRQVYIPNNEIREEFINCVSVSDWGEVSKALKNSAETLYAIWQKRPKQVSQGIEQAHFETSHIQYHDENALSYTISLALFAARNFYTVYRELPTGKGFADMVYLPRRKFLDKPALVVELKWNHSAQGAIDQIKRKQYVKSLENYEGSILLVGINYDKATKVHECVIEEWEK